MSKSIVDFNPVEAELAALLHPVHPSARLVRTMRERIKFKPPIEVARQFETPPSLLMILGGVLSASLLILTVARAFFYLANRSKA
jgi:hypothetical protein